jgi:Domain of unknown function (DUF4407)
MGDSQNSIPILYGGHTLTRNMPTDSYRQEGSNLISKLLIRASGARSSLLKMPGCSPDRTKYAGIGLIILLVAMSAFFSFSYAAWTIIHNKPLAILFGLWGAFFIFTIDRTIVAESVKTKGGNKEQLWFLLVRLLLAVAISFVITVPIEILIFQGPIDDYLNNLNQKAALVMESTLKAQYPSIELLKTRNINLEAEVQKAKEARNKAQAEMIKEGTGERGEGRTGKAGKGDFYDLKEQEFEEQDRQFNDRKTTTEAEIANNRKEIARLEAEADLKRKDSDKFRGNNNTLPTRISALHDLSDLNPAYGQMAWAITFLFIALDSTPVFLKVLSKRGLYDAIVERVDYEAIGSEDERRVNALSLMRQKINNQHKKDELILQHDYELFLQAETESKDNLLSKIMEIHERAMNTEEWETAYSKAIAEYVNSISSQLSRYARVFQLSEQEFDSYIRPELLKTAQKYAQPIAEDEMQRRRTHNSKESLFKQLENKFKELTEKWK